MGWGSSISKYEFFYYYGDPTQSRVLKGSRKKVNSLITNSEFYEQFKNIAARQTDKNLNMPNTLDLSIFHELDIPITICEIENAISESKVYHSPGFDNITVSYTHLTLPTICSV